MNDSPENPFQSPQTVEEPTVEEKISSTTLLHWAWFLQFFVSVFQLATGEFHDSWANPVFVLSGSSVMVMMLRHRAVWWFAVGAGILQFVYLLHTRSIVYDLGRKDLMVLVLACEVATILLLVLMFHPSLRGYYHRSNE